MSDLERERERIHLYQGLNMKLKQNTSVQSSCLPTPFLQEECSMNKLFSGNFKADYFLTAIVIFQTFTQRLFRASLCFNV